MKSRYQFEPDDPILSESDYIKELTNWAKKEHKKINILKAGKLPVVEIDGERLLCRLEPPKRVELPFLNTSSALLSFGFKFVYLYPVAQ